MMFYNYILICAVIAFVYAELLTDHGMIFNPLLRFSCKIPDFMQKPLIGCSKCVSGQLSLWVYLYYYIDTYSFLLHVYFISLSILITWLLNNLKRIIEN